MTIKGAAQAIGQGVGSVTDSAIDRLHRLLGALPSTNWLPFTGVLAALATVIAYLVGFLIQRHPEPVTFGMLLGFEASWLGFGVKQFRIKRETQDLPPREPRPSSGAVADAR